MNQSEPKQPVLALERLIDQVQALVEGSDAAEGFDADAWVLARIERPNPALGGAKPTDVLETIQGRDLVSRLLAQSQSGAYG